MISERFRLTAATFAARRIAVAYAGSPDGGVTVADVQGRVARSSKMLTRWPCGSTRHAIESRAASSETFGELVSRKSCRHRGVAVARRRASLGSSTQDARVFSVGADCETSPAPPRLKWQMMSRLDLSTCQQLQRERRKSTRFSRSLKNSSDPVLDELAS